MDPVRLTVNPSDTDDSLTLTLAAAKEMTGVTSFIVSTASWSDPRVAPPKGSLNLSASVSSLSITTGLSATRGTLKVFWDSFAPKESVPLVAA
jgi:hypothetical protein